jgi:hypothetical protein
MAVAQEKVGKEEAAQDVTVKVLLAGGHQYTLALKSDTPLLRSLLGSIMSRVQNQGNRTLFQIPVEANRAAVCFCSDELVAVVTEPPVFIRPNEPEETPPQADT